MTRLPGIDLELSPICLGTNTFGWTADAAASHAVLDGFVAGGGTFIDTADMYSTWVPGNSGGESETIIGEWIAHRGRHDDVVIATKVAAHPDFRGLAAETVAAGCDASLARLGVERIDLYYAHHDDAKRTIPEIAAAFDALVRAGKVGAIAASNFGPDRLREWVEHARAEGLAAPVALQPEYHLLRRADFEGALQPTTEALGLATFTYYGLASGFLTGKYRSAADVGQGARSGAVGTYATAEGFAVVDALVEVAQARGVAPATVALAWLRAHGVTAPIASARTAEQLPPLLAAGALELADDERSRLDAVSTPFA